MHLQAVLKTKEFKPPKLQASKQCQGISPTVEDSKKWNPPKPCFAKIKNLYPSERPKSPKRPFHKSASLVYEAARLYPLSRTLSPF